MPPCVNRPSYILHLLITHSGFEYEGRWRPSRSFDRTYLGIPSGLSRSWEGRSLPALYIRLYGEEGDVVAPVVQDEYLAWIVKGGISQDCIDYYGVTFDDLIPADDPGSEVLAINIIEVDNDGGVYANGGKYANEILLFSVNPKEYTGMKALAVSRYCQYKKVTKDRMRINSEVAERDGQSGNAHTSWNFIMTATSLTIHTKPIAKMLYASGSSRGSSRGHQPLGFSNRLPLDPHPLALKSN